MSHNQSRSSDLTATTPPTPTLNTSYRRNGRLQACEPCRKSKLKCDHVVPVCGRCAARNRARRCVYVDAPVPLPRRKHPTDPPPSLLTPPDTSTASPEPTIRGSTSQQGHEANPSSAYGDLASSPNGQHVTVLGQRTQAPASFVSRMSPATSQSEGQISQTLLSHGSLSNRPGYLGVTSYNSVITEDVPRLGITLNEEEEPEPLRSITLHEIIFKEAAQVFALFRDRSLVDRFHRRYFALSPGGASMTNPLAKIWTEMLWADYEDILREANPVQLRGLTEKVFQNTAGKVPFDRTFTLRQYAALGSGPNLRWEVLGILASLIGLTTKTLMASDPIFSEGTTVINRNAFAKECMEAAEICLAFCKKCERLNDMSLLLTSMAYDLMSCVDGDAAPTSYGRVGELITAMIASGYHQSCENDRTPLFLSEMRKRFFINTLGLECALATFLGRPPRLHYKYCRISMPLDLPDDIWLQPQSEIDRAIARLQNGWNPDGKIYRTTWTKISADVAARRQDILDLALIDYEKEEILFQAEQIRSKIARDLSKLPAHLQAPATFVRDANQNILPVDTLFPFCIRFGYTSNILLLQRLLVKKANADPTSLIEPARDAFKDVLNVATKGEIMRDLQCDLSWILVAYGIRTAATVAVELLKQERVPFHQRKLSKSETIQELSVFIAMLQALDPGDGHWQLCQQAVKVLKRILDRILDGSSDVRQPGGGGVLNGGDTPLLTSLDQVLYADTSQVQFDFATNVNLSTDIDFVNWLENMDWEQGNASWQMQEMTTV